MNITTDNKQMDYFPIRILSERTGVNSVTLRAWERRYGLLKPFRTEKGHRLYCDDDVVQVKRILYWINRGVSVGKVRGLLESGISEALPDIDPDSVWPQWQQIFLNSVLCLEQLKWEGMFLEATKQYPIQVVLQQGLLPALKMLHNQENVAVPLLVLQSSLIELLSKLRVSSLLVPINKANQLVVCMDASSLTSRLIGWLLADQDQPYSFIEGVRTSDELVGLISAVELKKLVIVSESLAHAEAKKCLEKVSSFESLDVDLIGSGFWLGLSELKLSEEQTVYTDLADYLQRAWQN
jgi:DNA-binding transcriptional MerR regulator